MGNCTSVPKSPPKHTINSKYQQKNLKQQKITLCDNYSTNSKSIHSEHNQFTTLFDKADFLTVENTQKYTTYEDNQIMVTSPKSAGSKKLPMNRNKHDLDINSVNKAMKFCSNVLTIMNSNMIGISTNCRPYLIANLGCAFPSVNQNGLLRDNTEKTPEGENFGFEFDDTWYYLSNELFYPKSHFYRVMTKNLLEDVDLHKNLIKEKLHPKIQETEGQTQGLLRSLSFGNHDSPVDPELIQCIDIMNTDDINYNDKELHSEKNKGKIKSIITPDNIVYKINDNPKEKVQSLGNSENINGDVYENIITTSKQNFSQNFQMKVEIQHQSIEKDQNLFINKTNKSNIHVENRSTATFKLPKLVESDNTTEHIDILPNAKQTFTCKTNIENPNEEIIYHSSNIVESKDFWLAGPRDAMNALHLDHDTGNDEGSIQQNMGVNNPNRVIAFKNQFDLKKKNKKPSKHFVKNYQENQIILEEHDSMNKCNENNNSDLKISQSNDIKAKSKIVSCSSHMNNQLILAYQFSNENQITEHNNNNYNDIRKKPNLQIEIHDDFSKPKKSNSMIHNKSIVNSKGANNSGSKLDEKNTCQAYIEIGSSLPINQLKSYSSVEVRKVNELQVTIPQNKLEGHHSPTPEGLQQNKSSVLSEKKENVNIYNNTELPTKLTTITTHTKSNPKNHIENQGYHDHHNVGSSSSNEKMKLNITHGKSDNLQKNPKNMVGISIEPETIYAKLDLSQFQINKHFQDENKKNRIEHISNNSSNYSQKSRRDIDSYRNLNLKANQSEIQINSKASFDNNPEGFNSYSFAHGKKFNHEKHRSTASNQYCQRISQSYINKNPIYDMVSKKVVNSKRNNVKQAKSKMTKRNPSSGSQNCKINGSPGANSKNTQNGQGVTNRFKQFVEDHEMKKLKGSPHKTHNFRYLDPNLMMSPVRARLNLDIDIEPNSNKI